MMSSCANLILILFRMLCFSNVEQSKAISCHYRYNIQPDSTNGTCHQLSSVILKCQVSGDNNNFTINWHHSKSQPDRNNIADDGNITESSNTTKHTSPNNRSMSVTSNLTLNKFDNTQNGYYWCSVKSRNDTARNPSRVVHILHQSPDCSTENGSCNRLYSESSTPRCADQEISLDIVLAQDCTSVEDMTTVVTQTPNAFSPLTTGIVAFVGSILLLMIAVILMCVSKRKLKLPKRVNKININSAFDNIHMNTSFGEDKMEESTRASEMLCQPNISYEHTISTMPKPTEHIYETVH